MNVVHPVVSVILGYKHNILCLEVDIAASASVHKCGGVGRNAD